MKKLLVLILTAGLLFTYGCSSVKKSNEYFENESYEVYYDKTNKIVMSEDTTKSESDVLASADFIAKIIPSEPTYIAGDVLKDYGRGVRGYASYIFDIVELYYDDSGMYKNGDRLKAISSQTVSNFLTDGINLQAGEEYIVFIDLYSTAIISTVQNYTNNLIVDPVNGIIPVNGDEYIVNNQMAQMIALAAETKEVEMTLNENLDEKAYLTTEILPFNEVVSNLTVVVEKDIKSLIDLYIAK
ncbi:MAG: hypothetical protein JXQ23_01905 [Clostridia bacterium]|nr:hypothetical protein [Clostridia bacterium]